MDYSGNALYMCVQCPVTVESRAHFLDSCLVVPILVATHEIHCHTYVASHVVGYDAPKSHLANEVLPPLEDPFL